MKRMLIELHNPWKSVLAHVEEFPFQAFRVDILGFKCGLIIQCGLVLETFSLHVYVVRFSISATRVLSVMLWVLWGQIQARRPASAKLLGC